MAKSKITTTFEKMGDNMAHVMNLSGVPSPYTMSQPKKGGGVRVQNSGTNAIKGRTMIHEANGPACKIKATLYEKNAAEAGLQTRNIRILPSAMGDRDFQPGAYGKVY